MAYNYSAGKEYMQKRNHRMKLRAVYSVVLGTVIITGCNGGHNSGGLNPLPTSTPQATAQPTATPRGTATPRPTATARPTTNIFVGSYQGEYERGQISGSNFYLTVNANGSATASFANDFVSGNTGVVIVRGTANLTTGALSLSGNAQNSAGRVETVRLTGTLRRLTQTIRGDGTVVSPSGDFNGEFWASKEIAAG